MKNQKIHRKEIIKSIIAESAIEHGFKLEWGTRTTWYILSMTREGLGQCVHFVAGNYTDLANASCNDKK